MSILTTEQAKTIASLYRQALAICPIDRGFRQGCRGTRVFLVGDINTHALLRVWVMVDEHVTTLCAYDKTIYVSHDEFEQEGYLLMKALATETSSLGYEADVTRQVQERNALTQAAYDKLVVALMGGINPPKPKTGFASYTAVDWLLWLGLVTVIGAVGFAVLIHFGVLK